jgi:hypothetical protein
MKFKGHKICTILLLICMVIFYKNSQVKALINSSGAENPNGTFYSDGTYEYTAGLNFILSNSSSDTRFWHDDPNYQGEITTSNLRDKSTTLQNGDRREWSYVTSEWFWYSEQNKYMPGVGYNEYCGDNWLPSNNGVIQGVQDGGSAIYTDDGSTYNRYRRAVLMIYRRPLPSAGNYDSSITSVNGAGTYNPGNGQLWVSGGHSIDFRYIGLASRADQNARYSENVNYNSMGFFSTDGTINDVQYMYRYGTGGYIASTNTGSIVSGMSLLAQYEYGNALWGQGADNSRYNGLSTKVSLNFSRNLDVTISDRCVEKYGHPSSYIGTFTYGGVGYSMIRSDCEGPSNTGYEVKNITDSGYDVYVYGVSDSRSGVNRVMFPTWTDYNGQDDIIWGTGTNLGGGTWYYHVDKSAHNNETGVYNTHVYMYDNVGNSTSFATPQTTILIRNATITTTAPQFVIAGQQVNYTVTATNNGTYPWTAATNFRLGTDGSTYPGAPGRYYLPANTTISTNGTYTWNVSYTAGSAGTVYTNNFRMLQEGVVWFGQTSTSTTTVLPHSPPIASFTMAPTTITPDLSITYTDNSYVNDISGSIVDPAISLIQSGWTGFTYTGTTYTNSVKANGYNGYNYFHTVGPATAGDTGETVSIPVSPNTDYIASERIRINTVGTSWDTNGRGQFYIVNGANNAGITSVSPTNTTGTWQYVKVAFNSGANTSIMVRLNAGNYTADVTDVRISPITNATYPEGIDNEEWSYSRNGGVTWSTATSTPPIRFATSGIYQIRERVHSTPTQYMVGEWSAYYIQNLIVNSKLINFRISNMVNPPTAYTFPILVANMPVDCKSGYQDEFDIDTIGEFDNVTIASYINGVYQATYNLTKTSDTGSTQTWHLNYILPLDTDNDSMVSYKINGSIIETSFNYDYNLNNSWGSTTIGGNVLHVIGNALEDAMVHRVN